MSSTLHDLLENWFWPIYGLIALLAVLFILTGEVSGWGWNFRGYFRANATKTDKPANPSETESSRTSGPC